MNQTPILTYFGNILLGNGGGAKIWSQSKINGGGAKIWSQSKINAADQSEISTQDESKDIKILTHFSPVSGTF